MQKSDFVRGADDESVAFVQKSDFVPADSEAAKRVQRVLEGFHIPRALRRDGRRSLVTDYEGGYVKDLIASPDKSRTAAILNSRATIADLTTGEHWLVEENFRITSGVMSSQALYLTGYRADEEGARAFVCAHDLKTTQELWSFDGARSSEPTLNAEMPQLFLAASFLYLSDDGSIRQLDISTGDVMNEGSSSEAVCFGFEQLDGVIAFEQLHQNGIGQSLLDAWRGARRVPIDSFAWLF